MPRTRLLTLTVLLMFSTTVKAQSPACDKLAGTQKELATKLLSSQYPYDCCDENILSCLNKKPVCKLAWRLAENICRRVSDGQDSEEIKHALSRRARSMLETSKSANFDLEKTPMAGSIDSKVTVVEYACARCPMCSKLTPLLYRAVTVGKLKDKARLYVKIFPIKSHKFSKEAAIGFLAAAKSGHFWQFLNHSFMNFDSFDNSKQADWAETIGIDRKTFEANMIDPEITKQLVANKKEGIINAIEATPAFFINGRKYMGDMSEEEIHDVIEEEYDKLSGQLFMKQ